MELELATVKNASEAMSVFLRRGKNYNETSRLATFKSWPFGDNKQCSRIKMAEAGFIFTGSSQDPDSAECFFCGKSLDGWEEDDNPFIEHYKHADYCEFAQMQKPQRQWTIDEYLKLMLVYEKRQLTQRYEDHRNQIQKRFNQLRKEAKSKK